MDSEALHLQYRGRDSNPHGLKKPADFKAPEQGADSPSTEADSSESGLTTPLNTHSNKHKTVRARVRTREELRRKARAFFRRMEKSPRYPKGRPSYLYVIEGGGLVKLGRSLNVKRRVRDLQRASPTPLQLLAVIPETMLSEEDAHERWSELRQHGEWFEPTPELRGWIDRVARRGRLAMDLHRRMGATLGRASAHPRRLSRLVRAEERVFQRQAEREEARQKESGCRFCGETETLQRPSVDPDHFYCASCGNWLRRVEKQGLAAVGQSYREAFEEAQERLRLHRLRRSAYEAGGAP